LNWKDIKEFIESAGEGLRADRERAMLCVAYETLARRGELVALERYVAAISGHSTRVGATQDLAALDIDLAAITQAGGWKSPRMPLQYAEKISAARSGMARAAEKAGRDSISE
jgi:integrase